MALAKEGDRLEVIQIAVTPGGYDDNKTIPPGTRGTVEHVYPGALGEQVFTKFENGRRLALIEGEDRYRILSRACDTYDQLEAMALAGTVCAITELDLDQLALAPGDQTDESIGQALLEAADLWQPPSAVDISELFQHAREHPDYVFGTIFVREDFPPDFSPRRANRNARVRVPQRLVQNAPPRAAHRPQICRRTRRDAVSAATGRGRDRPAHANIRSLMGRQSAETALKMALERGVWLVAWSAAAELPRVAIEDALALVLLTLDREPVRFPKAAERWCERFAEEARLHPTERGLVAAALAALPGPGARAGLIALDTVAQHHRLDRIRLVLHRRLEGRRQHG